MKRHRSPSMLRREPNRNPSPTPGYFHGRCVAVTSLSPDPKRVHRQRVCLQSWSDIGLSVVAVNTSAEMEKIQRRFPNVLFHCCDDTTTDYDTPTQRITTLLTVGAESGGVFMLINSDIAIVGGTAEIDSALNRPQMATIGVRCNHPPGMPSAATIEAYGLDVFILTPDMARLFTDSRYGIGKPCWDYAFPEVLRRNGIGFNWVKSPIFFHEWHKANWTRDEWNIGGKWLSESFGFAADHDYVQFRHDLELKQ